MAIYFAENLFKSIGTSTRRKCVERLYGILYGLRNQDATLTLALMSAFCDEDVINDRNRLQEFLDLNTQVLPYGLSCIGLIELQLDRMLKEVDSPRILRILRDLGSLDAVKAYEDLVYLVVCQEEAFADSDKEKTASKCFGLNIRGFITKTFDDLEKASVTVKPNHSLQDHYACFTVSANFETALTPIHSKHGVVKELEQKLMEMQIEPKQDFAYSLYENSVFLLPGLSSSVTVREGTRGINANTTLKEFITIMEKSTKAEQVVKKSAMITPSLSDLSGGLLPDSLTELRLFYNASGGRSSHGSSPLVTIGEGATRSIRFQISAFLFVPKSRSVGELAELADLTKKRQFAAMVEYLKRLSETPANVDEVSCPVPYHIISGPNVLTLLMDRTRRKDYNVPDKTLTELYDRFGLSGGNPVLRSEASFGKRLAISRKNIIAVGDKLLSKNSKFLEESPAGWEVTVVPGLYSYHHYKQDRFDDSGWGCAYRSLQTIFSWFVLQGFTDRPIPNHEQIQQILLEVKDRDKSIVGSKQWIGATEITRVLDYLLQVQCRIINVSSGSELGTAFASLKHHFETEGTPVMIGGGVYAYTIAGIAVNRTSGEVKALVVDPHYIGEDDVDVIIKKKGVAWRTPDFWEQGAFYNLCCPLRPEVF